jgi:hypothetical protein
MAELILARLKELLDYDPETGVFVWKVTRGSARPGDVAENRHVGGYRQVVISRKRYLSHRLAWFYINGQWPSDEIDHINRERADNRIANLREATRAQNVCRSVRRSKSGVHGVRRRDFGWQARIRVTGKDIHLGTYQTVDEAKTAYRIAAIHHFGEFARTE